MHAFQSLSCLRQDRSAMRIGILLVAALTAASPTRADITVGKMTTWPIVIPADAPPAERHAADEFRDLVAQATGTRMEIVTASGSQESGVFVGKASRQKTQDLGEEAFRIVIDDHRVEIAGGSPRGTLYGVYTFLEDRAGCSLPHARPHPRSPCRPRPGPESWRTCRPSAFFLEILVLWHEHGPPRTRGPAAQQRGDRPRGAGRPIELVVNLAQRQSIRSRGEAWQGPPRVLQPCGR